MEVHLVLQLATNLGSVVCYCYDVAVECYLILDVKIDFVKRYVSHKESNEIGLVT